MESHGSVMLALDHEDEQGFGAAGARLLGRFTIWLTPGLSPYDEYLRSALGWGVAKSDRKALFKRSTSWQGL